MKQKKKWMLPVAAGAALILCAGAALAAAGDENDPLVTLSYLNETFLPQLVSQVEDKAAARQSELTTAFTAQVAQYQEEVESAGGGTSETGGSTYTLVSLSRGQTMTLDLGCEVLLRVGTATVNCGSDPALVDVSTGGTLNKGSALEKNHLYMATMTDRVVTATGESVKLMVRGGYTIS
jgi:hypothetical protein